MKKLVIKLILIYAALIGIWFFGREHNDSRVNALYGFGFLILGILAWFFAARASSQLEDGVTAKKVVFAEFIISIAALFLAVYSVIQFSKRLTPYGAEREIYVWQTGIGLLWLFVCVTSLVVYGFFESFPKSDKDISTKES